MEYPFLHCLSPVKVYNKYTDDFQLVPCCKCSACLNKRSARNKRLCELEEQSEYNVTYFVTLTYDNEHLPVFEYVEDTPNSNCFYLVDKCKRSSNFGNVALPDPIKLSNKELALLSSTNLYLPKNHFSYLFYKDVQLFNKRLRKHIDRKYNEKIRYYIVGEYGHKSLRAHWHIIYFCRKEFQDVFNERFVCSLWEKGRVDTDRCKGGAVNYCAGYINSRATLPDVYKILKIQPTAKHSIKLGFVSMQKSFNSLVNQVLSSENDRRTEIKSYYQSNGRIVEMPLDTTYQNALFPRSFRFEYITANQHFLQYFRAFSFYEQKFGNFRTIRELSDKLFSYLLTENLSNDAYSRKFKELLCLSSLDYYLQTNERKTEYNRLYHFLRFSRNYCLKIKRNPNYHKELVSYYDRKNYINLCKQYELQSSYFQDNEFSENSLSLFYDAIFSVHELKKTMAYSSFSTKNQMIHEQKLLRKKMNDIANVLST